MRKFPLINFKEFLNKQLLTFQYKSRHNFFLALLLFLLLISCSATKRFPTNNTSTNKSPTTTTTTTTNEETKITSPVSEIRVLLDEPETSTNLTLQSAVYLYAREDRLALINSGNMVECYNNNGRMKIRVQGKDFESDNFFLEAVNDNKIMFNGENYKGRILLSPSAGNSIGIINYIDLEDYVKGVLSREMPVGNKSENLEALKALALCARTYAVIRMLEGKTIYDLFDDTRDQVYGGLNAEFPLTNQAVDETSRMIIKFKDHPAVLYYHSTCGGKTEAASNVFTDKDIPYMPGVEDGSEPYCKISPRFEWEEKYFKDDIVERLYKAGQLYSSNFRLVEVNIKSRFPSGRVNELEFLLDDEYNNSKTISLFGNNMRNVLRTGEGKAILWSTMFNINEENNMIVFNGKGFGHGVGLCQWGAIALSKKGWNFTEILQHYYPGIEIGYLDD